MKNISSALAALMLTLFFGCSGDQTEDVKSAKTPSVKQKADSTCLITVISSQTYDSVASHYRNSFSADTTSISKRGPQLIIPTIPRNTVFRDTMSQTDESLNLVYKYLGQFKEPGIFAVRCQFYGINKFILICKHKGKQTNYLKLL
jgi:hypothetical protein